MDLFNELDKKFDKLYKKKKFIKSIDWENNNPTLISRVSLTDKTGNIIELTFKQKRILK